MEHMGNDNWPNMSDDDSAKSVVPRVENRIPDFIATAASGYMPLAILGGLVGASLICMLFLKPSPHDYCVRGAAYLNCDPPTVQQLAAMSPSEISYRDRGRAYLRMGEYARAIDDLNEALRRDPADTESLLNRASALQQVGDDDRALADYAASFRRGDRNHDTYLGRGKLFTRQGDYIRAIVDFTHAVDLAPRNSEAYIWRGYNYVRIGDDQAALVDLDKAGALDDHNVDVWRYRAGALYRLRQYAEAGRSVGRGIALVQDPREAPELWYYRALVTAKLSPASAAATSAVRADLATANESSDDDAPLLVMLCVDTTLLGFLDLATSPCDRAAKHPDDKGNALGARGYLKMRLGQWAQAAIDLEGSLGAAPHNANTLYMHAYVKERLGDTLAAQQDYADARNRDGNIDDAMRDLGIAPGTTSLGPVAPRQMP
ncbi:tetratricopeptide repeat protein [Dongia rigui]|uniref:Tetratricopeptide repeat protein n=1 Tax=Dongia rigui TaxID=940149 RepID=A0ABU5E369_9PROT|nr:tetratricopeptide repeat protein [Dongia rigui]MDY0873348.1 tetratricopeptide repeat protein [Dongia rigui]